MSDGSTNIHLGVVQHHFVRRQFLSQGHVIIKLVNFRHKYFHMLGILLRTTERVFHGCNYNPVVRA